MDQKGGGNNPKLTYSDGRGEEKGGRREKKGKRVVRGRTFTVIIYHHLDLKTRGLLVGKIPGTKNKFFGTKNKLRLQKWCKFTENSGSVVGAKI